MQNEQAPEWVQKLADDYNSKIENEQLESKNEYQPFIKMGIITESENYFIPFFEIGNQRFKLQSQENQETAIWYTDCLAKAFLKIPNSIVEDIK